MIRIMFSEGMPYGGVTGIESAEEVDSNELADLISLEGQITIVSNRRTIVDEVFGLIEITELLDKGIFVSGSCEADRLIAEGISYWIASLGYTSQEFIEAICKGFHLEN